MKKLSLLSLMFLIFSFANAYGAEIKFKTNSSDQSSALTTSTFKNQVSAGADFIASVNSVNRVYAGTSGLKFGTSSNAGDFTITLADAAQLKNPTITIASAKYKTESTSFEVYLNGATSANATIAAGATSSNSFTFSGIVTKIQIKSKGKRAYLSSITIEGEEGGSDLTPTSLAWSAETAIATIGADNTFPTLITTPTDLTGITYASSNTDIATIATDGTITLCACGVTTIMASFAGDDTHKVADDAKYTLTVVNPNAPEYQLFTGNLQAGEYVVYYNKVAMKAAVSSDRLGYETVNPIEDVIQTDNATIIWKIEQNGEYWTLYNTSAGKYAAGNGTKNQAALVSSVSDAALWTVTVSNGKFEFVNKKNAEESVNKNLRYNEGYGFACYGTSTGGALSLYKKADDANAISSPTISGADEFIESTEVTISAEDGLKVYYTLDGTDPTNASTEYTAPFELTATTTVKAVAYDGEKASGIISKTFKQLQVLTCEEAAGLCTETESADKYVIRGYVTNIATAWSDQYSNISFWMADTKNGGKVFEAFRSTPIAAADKAVKVGDYVEVIGKIVLYGTTPETTQGGTYTIIPAPVVNHTIIVSANPAEAGTVTGGGEFEETDEITVKATANEGYEFVNWTEGEEVVSTNAEYTFEVLADRNLVANFIKKTISYELNGGELVVEVPTQEELWASFKTAAGLTTLGTLAEITEAGAGKPHNDPDNPCACRIICAKLLDANVNAVFALPEWAWLKAYIMTVQSGLPEASNVSWRYAFAAFFLQSQHSAYPASADFTEAGKPENWGAAYQAAHAVVLPTEPVDAPYTLPTPVKEGYKFVGWYDNAEGTGEPMTVIPAGWDGTLYAIWVEIYTITVEAENGTVEGAGNYEHGAEATLTATAAEGYEFTCWTSGEDTVSTANPYKFTVTADVALVANFKEVEPEIEWMKMDLEITNLVTEVMEVGGAKFLQLMGRDDMNDADVTLFLNNYADVDDDYVVNAGSSYMTFGGTELTVIEGTMTQTSETEKGTIYTGTVRASAEEEGETMYLEFTLTMYAAPATVLVLTDAIVAINEELGTLTFNVPTGEGEGEGYYAELANYTAPGVHQGPQICLFKTPEVVAYTNYAETSVADGVITLKGEFTSQNGPKFDLTISGKLPGSATALDNLNTTVAPVKAIINGQLIIINNGVQYNAQGQVIK